MRSSVWGAFLRFTEPIESRLPYLYLDGAKPRGLVTIGIGDLCPLSLAVRLPFVMPDGTRATRAEITAQWARVDAAQNRAGTGGGRQADLSSIRLLDADIDQLVYGKLREVNAQLQAMFPAFEEWPADAQLARISHAWAAGAAAPYPRMNAACTALDFATAAGECTLHPLIATIPERNRRNRLLFHNAAFVLEKGMDPEPLYWPADLCPDEETQPQSAASRPTIYAPAGEKS